MNRWLQRLAELDGGGAPARTQDSVQFGQNGQNSRLSQQFGQFAHFVQIAQPPGSERPAEISSVAASPVPASFFDHRCSACGQPARFGYEVRVLHGEEGRWFCAAHRPEAGRA
jgi:hypothetical protein